MKVKNEYTLQSPVPCRQYYAGTRAVLFFAIFFHDKRERLLDSNKALELHSRADFSWVKQDRLLADHCNRDRIILRTHRNVSRHNFVGGAHLGIGSSPMVGTFYKQGAAVKDWNRNQSELNEDWSPERHNSRYMASGIDIAVLHSAQLEPSRSTITVRKKCDVHVCAAAGCLQLLRRAVSLKCFSINHVDFDGATLAIPHSPSIQPNDECDQRTMQKLAV